MKKIEDTLDDWAYCVPARGYIYRENGNIWNLSAVPAIGIEMHLKSLGVPLEDISFALKSKLHRVVHGADIFPDNENKNLKFARVGDQGLTYVNLYRPSTLVPKEGPFPRIEKMILYLCGDDPEGASWFTQWLAFKVRNPVALPKVACVFSTSPGAGKGTLFLIIQACMGKDNCQILQRSSLESNFNARWTQKLFVLADEITTPDNSKDISQQLKLLVDSNEIEQQGKGKDQVQVQNRLAWIFCSNDKTTPIVLERGDRRFSVFKNFRPISAEYHHELKSFYTRDGASGEFTQDFQEEVRAFYHHLLNCPVDVRFIGLPYENAARKELINASLPAHEAFFAAVQEDGVDDLLQSYLDSRDSDEFMVTRKDWDFGDKGLSTRVLYQVYRHFCKTTGAKPLKVQKFGMALNNSNLGWDPYRGQTAKGTRVNCYKVPRST